MITHDPNYCARNLDNIFQEDDPFHGQPMYKTLQTPYFHAYETVQDFVDASNLDPDCANVRCRPLPSGKSSEKGNMARDVGWKQKTMWIAGYQDPYSRYQSHGQSLYSQSGQAEPEQQSSI